MLEYGDYKLYAHYLDDHIHISIEKENINNIIDWATSEFGRTVLIMDAESHQDVDHVLDEWIPIDERIEIEASDHGLLVCSKYTLDMIAVPR